MLAAIDPVVGFFVLGLVAGLLGSDLKLSSGLYDTLTIYLLIAIGLKGVCRNSNYWRCLVKNSNKFCRFNTIHIRHIDIHKYCIELVCRSK